MARLAAVAARHGAGRGQDEALGRLERPKGRQGPLQGHKGTALRQEHEGREVACDELSDL